MTIVTDKFNILFTSAGRRVALIRLFRDALMSLGLDGRFVTTDMREDAPARFVADEHIIVPNADDPGYVESLLTICREREIKLIVPLIDPELHILAENREAFRSVGVVPLVSSPLVTALSLDKRLTSAFFAGIGVSSPTVVDVGSEDRRNLPYPLIIKPATGSGSVGVQRISDLEDLEFFLRRTKDPIVQELLSGDEYTIDVLADTDGEPRCVVPRLRIETRAGEVSKGITVKHSLLIDHATKVVRSLPGAYGPITLQCFLTPTQDVSFLEINPRFGGGFPLSAAAGADFPRWVIQWILKQNPKVPKDCWKEGLMMLRFDEGIFVNKDDVHAL